MYETHFKFVGQIVVVHTSVGQAGNEKSTCIFVGSIDVYMKQLAFYTPASKHQ